MNSFHFREGRKYRTSFSHALPINDFDLLASHARTLLPAALASVSFGFVLVRVRVRAASIARACSIAAIKFNAACLSVYMHKLSSYTSFLLWAILQENLEESMDCKLRRDPDSRAWSTDLLEFSADFSLDLRRHNGKILFWQRIAAATSTINAILPIISAEPALFGVYADDFFSM